MLNPTREVICSCEHTWDSGVLENGRTETAHTDHTNGSVEFILVYDWTSGVACSKGLSVQDEGQKNIQ